MKERKSKVNWEDYPKIEKCTDMGDTNGNKMDIEVKEAEGRPITSEKPEKVMVAKATTAWSVSV